MLFGFIFGLSIERVALIGLSVLALIVAFVVLIIIGRRLPRKLRRRSFLRQWRNLQKLCVTRKTWPEAIKQADDLLDSALRRRSFKGASMGERLVSAQDIFTDNDALWLAHKLRTKIESNPEFKLKKAEVRDALLGIGQALKDLGAL